jgi:hypothetical protein
LPVDETGVGAGVTQGLDELCEVTLKAGDAAGWQYDVTTTTGVELTTFDVAVLLF